MARKWIKGSNDFIIAGREVSLIVNILGIASIGYAGTTLTLSPAFALMGGSIKGFFMLGFCYSFVGIGSYGLFVAPIARRSGAHTLPEWMEIKFDKRVRVIVAITAIIAMIGITANNVVSMAYILAGFTEVSVLLLIIIGFLLFLGFMYVSGMWAVALTDFFQGILCIVAIPLTIITLLMKFGGFEFVSNNWPGGGDWLWTGISGGTFPWFSLRYPSVLVALILYGLALVWGSNHYWIRCSSVRSERVASHSFLWASILLVLANGIIYVLIGSYSGAAYPTVFQPIGEIAPASAFGFLIKDINPLIAAYLLITTIAASISTSTATHIAGSSMVFRDIYQRFFRPNASSADLVKPSKIITLLFGVACLILCFYPGGPVYLFAFSTAWLTPSAVALILGLYWSKVSPTGSFVGVLSGVIFLSAWTLLDLTKLYPLTAKFGHMAIPGVILTLVITVIVSLLTPEKINFLTMNKIKLDDIDNKILNSIRKGYAVMGELTDILGIDSGLTSDRLKKLEANGIIKRDSTAGSGYYLFSITEKGEEYLPQLSKKEKLLYNDYIDSDSLAIIDYVNNTTKVNASDLLKTVNMETQAISTIIASLVRRGFLKESGLIKRNIDISSKGKEMLNKYKKLLEEKEENVDEKN
jgi:SSS family solute:Na+ symporter